jgi:cell division septation protein DedD
MKRDGETGEFELVLGNAQLLSGLFVVVLLFAVFFALGYVVGQNSPRSVKLPETAATGQGDRPQPVTATQQPAPPGAAGVETPATQPAADANSNAAGQAQPSAPAAAAQEAAPAPVPAPAAPEVEEPAPGSYWQVMALKQADAEVVVRSLKDKGFSATTAPGRNNLTRVLVGPYKDTASMSKAKTALENAGFHPIKK